MEFARVIFLDIDKDTNWNIESYWHKYIYQIESRADHTFIWNYLF